MIPVCGLCRERPSDYIRFLPGRHAIAGRCADCAADEIEAATFGEASLQTRQIEVVTASSRRAEVIQREPDEKYMDTFKNPMAPVATNAQYQP